MDSGDSQGKAAIEAILAAPVTVVVGHYGAGKTSLCLNLALRAVEQGYRTILADLDVVNPYFRAAEYRSMLEQAGVSVVAPVFSERGSNLDVPSLNGAIVPAIQQAQEDPDKVRLIVDAGGDDVGATALGRFASRIAAAPYQMVYVVNSRRLLTASADEAVEVLREIEVKARLSATAVVSNAHLKADTTEDVVKKGTEMTALVAERIGVPLLAYTVAPGLAVPSATEGPLAFPLTVTVCAPWE